MTTPAQPTATSAADLTRLFDCPPIANLSLADRERLVEAVTVATVEQGQDIVTQDTPGDTFYVLLEGIVEVLKANNGQVVPLRDMEAGAYFGEQALLGKKDGLRSATVRAKTQCRIASISADVFIEAIATLAQNRDLFESDAAAAVYREIRKSLDAFLASELNENADGVERLNFRADAVLVREGEPTDSVYMILSGVAVASKLINAETRTLGRMGTGQLIGELGVINKQARTATVTAQSDVEALKIAADAFLRWHAAHPDVSGFFNSLSHVYQLSEGRRISVFLGEVGGAKAVTSVVGGAIGGVVSTRVLEKGVVVFTNAAADALPGERAEIHYADDRIKRDLRVIVKERRGEKIDRCVVYALSAEGIDNDLGTLYQHILDLEEIPAVALRRFERTGFLGGGAAKSDRLCPCLGLGAKELTQATQELGCDYAVLQANIGVGGICGGCERPVRAFLSQDSSTEPAAPHDASSGAANPDANAKANAGVIPTGTVADVPPALLRTEEVQLAALLARGMGTENTSVTREQVAVRLRATGVRDMNFFIDMLFPGVFTHYARATYATLAAAVGRGIGFGPWRSDALKPLPWRKALAAKTLQRIYRMGRKGVAATVGATALLHTAIDPESAMPLWGGTLLFLVFAYGVLSLTPTGRFLRVFITGGPSRFHRALWAAFGDEQKLGTMRFTPWGKSTHVVRDERLVDYILQHPDVYARTALDRYPAFAEHSVLGGGSSGVWLAYRMLCEEYFAERYREDLEDIRAIVRERLAMWDTMEQIDLLREVYKIIVEIHGRVFFQTSFGCFDAQPKPDFADLIDRTLGPGVILFNDPLDGEIEQLQLRCFEAVKGSTKPDSIGGILRTAWEAGEINEREVRENAVMYMLAQAPTMGSFWTIYRAVKTGTQATLRDNRRELVKAIKEELRLHAPVSTMFSRTVLRDDKLGDHAMKAGDTIIMSPMLIHTNPAQWTTPYKHDPQRWSVSVGDGKEIVDPKTDPADANARPHALPEGTHSARYVPFGGGGQACQGRWFAADEMMIVVEEILKKGQLTILKDQDLLDRPLYDQVQFHVYNRPFNDVQMKLTAAIK
jgi:CRP-like cAMP-binding protein/cytochrome P450/bacterioferritin-associated ferredoxin